MCIIELLSHGISLFDDLKDTDEYLYFCSICFYSISLYVWQLWVWTWKILFLLLETSFYRLNQNDRREIIITSRPSPSLDVLEPDKKHDPAFSGSFQTQWQESQSWYVAVILNKVCFVGHLYSLQKLKIMARYRKVIQIQLDEKRKKNSCCITPNTYI